MYTPYHLTKCLCLAISSFMDGSIFGGSLLVSCSSKPVIAAIISSFFSFVIKVTSLCNVIPRLLRLMVFYHKGLTNAIGRVILYKDSILIIVGSLFGQLALYHELLSFYILSL